MGLRFRLRADYPISRLPAPGPRRAAALKRYGMIVADNGTSWYISGAPSRALVNDDLHTLGRVPGSAFQVVDTSSLRPRAG